MISNPLISIITPVYNSSQFLAETINSVLDQSYNNWEHILVNDFSTDDSMEIILSFMKLDKRIKLGFHDQNLGVAEARNLGTKLAKGNLIAFLDSDDKWEKDKLEVQVGFMLEKKCNLSHTAYRKININGDIVANFIPVSKSIDYYKLLTHNEIGLLTSMYNVDMLGKKYFTKMGHEDYSFWLQILKNKECSLGINIVLASYRIHSNSLSHNKIRAAQFTWNIYRKSQNLSFFKSIYYFSFYMIKATRKFFIK